MESLWLFVVFDVHFLVQSALWEEEFSTRDGVRCFTYPSRAPSQITAFCFFFRPNFAPLALWQTEINSRLPFGYSFHHFAWINFKKLKHML